MNHGQHGEKMLVFLLLLLSLFTSLAFGSIQDTSFDEDSSSQNKPLMTVVQVTPAVKTPAVPKCTKALMKHVFAFSYGKPFVGELS